MTSLDSRAPRALDNDTEGAAHLLRLCLDLQLDAMLLTLGAAGAMVEEQSVPWRRWLDEDVDLACTLAAQTLAGGAAVPPTLGTELDRAVPATTIDTLTALYDSMRDRLDDLPETRTTRDALRRCEARLAELTDYRLATTPPRGIDLTAEHHYLPGELLG